SARRVRSSGLALRNRIVPWSFARIPVALSGSEVDHCAALPSTGKTLPTARAPARGAPTAPALFESVYLGRQKSPPRLSSAEDDVARVPPPARSAGGVEAPAEGVARFLPERLRALLHRRSRPQGRGPRRGVAPQDPEGHDTMLRRRLAPRLTFNVIYEHDDS